MDTHDRRASAGRGRVTLACLMLTASLPVTAADFYVSRNGTPQGNGSISSPWDIATMFRHPASLRPGDTVYLREGVYQAPQRLTYICRLNGAAGAYITLRPYKSEKVVIDGGIQVLGSWVTIRDLEVMNSNPVRHTSETGSFPSNITQPIGIDVFGRNVRVINNVIHDTGNGIGAWQDANDNEFHGNILYYSGWKAPDRGHGHGIYMQNNAGRKVLTDNISFHHFSHGLQIYGSSATYLNNFELEGNIAFNNGSLASQFTRNILVGGTAVAKNPVLRSNYTYYPTTRNHGGDNNLGYYSSGSGCSNAIIEDNYFVSGGVALSMWKCSASSFKGNTAIGEIRGFSASSLPGNTFKSLNVRPKGQKIFVRPNQYERGRAHVVVFNWDRLPAAEVDLSGSGLSIGDLYEIHDVQNLTGPPVARGAWTGAPVRLPMNLTAVALPVGAAPPQHTDMEFNVFLVRRVDTGTDTGVQPLVISDVTKADISSNSAVLSWKTNRAATGQIEYGVSAALGSASAIAASGTKHSITLNGLPAASTIHYRVRSVASDGEVAVLTGTFVTLPNPPPPTPTPTPEPPPPTPDPTPTPTPDPAPAPSAPSVVTYFEAESGSRQPPTGYLAVEDRFALVSSPAASGGRYLMAATAEKSYVSFNVLAPEQGTYALWLRVLAPSASASELYVSIDGGPEQVFPAAYGVWGPNWQWSRLTVASGSAPTTRALSLSRAWHRISIRARDAGVAIDRLLLVNSMSFVPSK